MPLRCLAPCLKLQSVSRPVQWLSRNPGPVQWLSRVQTGPMAVHDSRTRPVAVQEDKSFLDVHKGHRVKGDFLHIFGGFFGSIRAHMGPCGPIQACMGPARALEEREKITKNTFCFYVTLCFQKSSFLTSIRRFLMILMCSSDFWPKYVSEQLYKVTSKSKFSTQNI